MAISRYRNTPKIDRKYFGTFNFPSKKQLDKIASFQIIFSSTDRLDVLSAKYYGTDEYWWVIAVANGIEWPLGIIPGTTIKIPINLEEVLDLV